MKNGKSKIENRKFTLVVVGSSVGGLQALRALLSRLPRTFPLPVAIVQHRAPNSDDSLAMLLGRVSTLPVCEPLDKQPVEPGFVYLSPAGYHLLVEDGRFALSTEGAVAFARPSADVLFESAADAFGPGVIAVVLTGASADGARGAARVKTRGGYVIIQAPQTAEASTMPEAALQAVPGAPTMPVEEIGPWLTKICQMQKSPHRS